MSRKTILPNIAYDTQRRSYYVTIRHTPEPGGPSRRTVQCYPTLELAIQALDRRGGMDLLSRGEDLEKLTVGQWLTYWLEQIIKPSRSASTVHGYHMIIRNHLSPGLGTIQMNKLTAAQVQQYLNRMQAKGLCTNTVRKHYMVLHNALEHARKQELILRNVSEHVILPSASDPTHHFYDSETMAKLFEILAGTSMEPVVKLAGYLGLRRSEICGLKWNHVDLEQKVITIAEARTTVNGRPVNKSTKNRSSIRRLGYAGLADIEELMERLWRRRQEDVERLGDDYEDGGYEIVSGHRRQKASELAGYADMPCIIRNLTDEQAITQMVEDNTNQRENILPSERAKALKMQLEAIKHQGAKNFTSGQIDPKDARKRSNEIVAERNKMTVKQVQRYIKLNDLVPDLQKMMDEGQVKFTPAVELSYIKPKNQQYIAVAIESQQSSPSLSQAQRMRELDQKGVLNGDVIDGIMMEDKKEVDKVILTGAELGKYFGKETTPREMKDQIIKLLDDWKGQQKEVAKPEKKKAQPEK